MQAGVAGVARQTGRKGKGTQPSEEKKTSLADKLHAEKTVHSQWKGEKENQRSRVAEREKGMEIGRKGRIVGSRGINVGGLGFLRFFSDPT